MHRKNIIGTLMFMSGIYAAGALPCCAQTFDSSGDGKLKGDFFVRQVVTTNLDTITSAIGRAISVTGIMTFDGQGGYTFHGQMLDTAAGSSALPYSVTGTYAVQSNGMAQIQNPIDAYSTATEYGAVTGVGPVSIVASATEGAYNDVFVAIQAGSGATNSTLTGTYQVGFIDFLEAKVSQVRDGYYTLTSTGSGALGTVTVNGAMANDNSADVAQTFPGVTYSILSGNGAGTLTFPTASTPLTTLVSGQKTFYVSADGSLLLGGDPNGFDLILGVKGLSGTSANSLYQGTYYNAALENDASDEADGNNEIDSFYGSTLALGTQTATISHERLAYFDSSAYDYTTDGSYDFSSGPAYNDSTYQYFLGASGKAVLIVGTGATYSLSVNLWAQPSQATSVFIDPLSIFNAASYAPITNPVAPGEIVSIFGVGLAGSPQAAQTLPLPDTLGTTQVTVNGRPAPLLYVSSTQINLLIPFATSEPFATFQVTNNNVASNQVTVYTNLTAPGVFTFASLNGVNYPPGIGPAAVLHLDYTLVTSDSPAKPGETLVLYLTGLGAVTPPANDGAAGPSNPPSPADETGSIGVDVYDSSGADTAATVGFAGLAPGFAGLNQINFTVPGSAASGMGYVDVSSNEGYTVEAKLFIQ
jgi:uncharacterized protein (TIGR03437 family)